VNNACSASLKSSKFSRCRYSHGSHLSKSISQVIDICNVARVEWNIEVSLDDVKDGHVVASVYKLLDNMPAKKPAANDHIDILHPRSTG